MKPRHRLILIVTGIVVIGCLMVTAIVLRQHQHMSQINSYTDCVRAGYPIQDSYPSKCGLPNGRSFVNPDEQPLQNVPSANPSPISTGERTCPDEWIDNRMPTVGEVTTPKEYFIIDGMRRELSEFDVNWVRQSCHVNEPEAVY